MVKKNACVFISGYGSNLKSLIKHSRDYRFPINIKLVVCNNVDAKGVLHAKKNSIPFDVPFPSSSILSCHEEKLVPKIFVPSEKVIKSSIFL